MIKKNSLLWLRNFTALSMMFALLTATSLVASAAPEKDLAMGELLISGSSVTLNGENAFTGRTFFSSGTLATAEGSTASVNLGKLGSVSIAPSTVLSLSFGNNSINGTLTSGTITVLNSEGVAVTVVNAEGTMINGVEGLYSTNESELRSAKAAKAPVSNGAQTALILLFAGAVAATVVYLVVKDDSTTVGSTVSPVR